MIVEEGFPPARAMVCRRIAGSGFETPKVSAPPEAAFEKYRKDDKDAARKFYKKYLDVKGVAVLASGEVADEALVRTHHIVTHVLAGTSIIGPSVGVPIINEHNGVQSKPDFRVLTGIGARLN